MKDDTETHMVTHNGLQIEVTILKRGGYYVPLNYVVYKGNQAINHRLSDTFIKKIEDILADYCTEMNLKLH